MVDLSNGSKRSLPFRQKPVKVFEAKLCACNGTVILVVAVVDGVQLWQSDAASNSDFPRGDLRDRSDGSACVERRVSVQEPGETSRERPRRDPRDGARLRSLAVRSDPL